MTFSEQLARFGLARFGIPDDYPDLMRWKEACQYSGIGRDERRQMELYGRKLGADRANWFAIARPVTTVDTRFSLYLDHCWVNYTLTAL
ncbi:hypothetical protein GCM10027288_11860 [Bordetella tumbae]